MTVGVPLGLLAALAAGPVVAAYFFRRRQPPRTVSALFLWRAPSSQAVDGPRLERFNRQASLLLEFAAVAAATLFLADVRCGDAGHMTHRVVVVDGSLSMRARHDGVEVAARVREAIAEVARGAESLTVVESGVHPRVRAGPLWDTGRALRALDGWVPSQPWHEPLPALQLALDIAGAEGAVTFFTDAPVEPVPPRVAVHALGRPADNVGLVSASRRDVGGVATVVAQVSSFAASPVRVPVRFEVDGLEPLVQSVELAPGQTGSVRAVLPTKAPVTVVLPADALVEDGRATLHPAEDAPIRVELRAGLDPAAEAALRRFFSVVEGATFETPGDVTVGPPGGDGLVQVGAVGPLRSFVGPFFTRGSSPLLDDVHLGGVVWTAGANVPGRVLVGMGEVALLAEDEATGALRFNLDLSRSNLHRTPAWPVLLGNVLQWAAARRPGFARPLLLIGDDVRVTTTEAGCRLRSGAEEQRVAATGSLVLSALPAPGRWELWCGRTLVDGLDVLALDARESDLRQRSTQVSAAQSSGTAPRDERSVWPLVALVAALVGDAWVLRRR